MSSRLTRELLEKVSIFLNGVSAVAAEPYLYDLCSRAVAEIAPKSPGYFENPACPPKFVSWVADGLHSIYEKGPDIDDLQGEVHAAIECLAVIARKNADRGNTTDMPVQQELMRFFETCGMWEKGSGLLVCVAYYDLE